MVSIRWMALLAVTVPGLALAQVGPNPAVQGSQDPSVGPTSDAATAPDDVRVGNQPRPGIPQSDTPDSASSDDTAAPGDEPTRAKKSTAPTSETKRKPR